MPELFHTITCLLRLYALPDTQWCPSQSNPANSITEIFGSTLFAFKWPARPKNKTSLPWLIRIHDSQQQSAFLRGGLPPSTQGHCGYRISFRSSYFTPFCVPLFDSSGEMPWIRSSTIQTEKPCQGWPTWRLKPSGNIGWTSNSLFCSVSDPTVRLEGISKNLSDQYPYLYPSMFIFPFRDILRTLRREYCLTNKYPVLTE